MNDDIISSIREKYISWEINFLCSTCVAEFVKKEEVCLIISRDCDSLNISIMMRDVLYIQNEFVSEVIVSDLKLQTWLKETFLNSWRETELKVTRVLGLL